MHTRALPLMFAIALIPGVLRAQSPWAVEVRAGAVFGSGDLGVTTGPSVGYFALGGVDAAPSLGLAVTTPGFFAGLQPRAAVSYAPPADVSGTWIPCDPGLACPSILLPMDGRASRLEALVGAELPLAVVSGPIRPYVTVGVGVRRYGFSWSPIGNADDSFFLDGGTYGETDFLGRVAVGFAMDLGPLAATLEGGADLSAFGAGRVPIPRDQLALYPEPTIDLGRTNLQEYTVTLGLRRQLH